MEAEIGQQLGSTRRLASTALCSAQPPTTALQVTHRLLLMKMLRVIVIALVQHQIGDLKTWKRKKAWETD